MSWKKFEHNRKNESTTNGPFRILKKDDVIAAKSGKNLWNNSKKTLGLEDYDSEINFGLEKFILLHIYKYI